MLTWQWTWGPVLDGVADALEQMRVQLLQYHAESCYGQFEFVTGHAEALTAVDNLVATREAISGVAAKAGLVASFLPKLSPAQAGNGSHVHFSIWKVRQYTLPLNPVWSPV